MHHLNILVGYEFIIVHYGETFDNNQKRIGLNQNNLVYYE